MPQSYQRISPQLARQIKLIITDVDGTITSGGNYISSAVSRAIYRLQEHNIIVGLASGRTLRELESLAHELGITGPIIAENGGVAKLSVNDDLVELGYSQQPALEALIKLKTLYPTAIREREDNKDRLIDVVIWPCGIEVPELRRHLVQTQILDSGYILHLMQEGISKGRTLLRLLDTVAGENLTNTDIMVFGDSTTDMSLFKLFPHCVFIANPKLTTPQWRGLKKIAKYASNLPVEEGFVEVISHIISVRTLKT